MAAGKRIKALREKIDKERLYPVEEALKLIADHSTIKFPESIDVSIRLGIDPKKSDQVVRGSVALPHGLGKVVRVAAFAEGSELEAAKAAGADPAGLDDLAKAITDGKLDFDVVVAAPSAMKVVGRLGPILGPRGLMPSPRDGTVSADLGAVVAGVKAGQFRFKTDRYGLVHGSIGRVSFDAAALKENLQALCESLRKAKPSTAKGIYFRSTSLSSTMGPGIRVDTTDLID
ncbi:MAG: 50S ribosomal protein L1 [Gammaproteobacteria bacterium]